MQGNCYEMLTNSLVSVWLISPWVLLSVVPDPYNDRLNAEDYVKKYQAHHSLQNWQNGTKTSCYKITKQQKNAITTGILSRSGKSENVFFLCAKVSIWLSGGQ